MKGCMFELLLSVPGAAHPETELLCHRASVLPCLVLVVVVSIVHAGRARCHWATPPPFFLFVNGNASFPQWLHMFNLPTSVGKSSGSLCPLSCLWMAILIDTQCPLLFCISLMSCEAEGTFWPFLYPWFGDLSTPALGFQSGCLLWRLSFSRRIFLTYILIWASQQICDLQIFSPLRGLAFTHVRD